MKLAKIFIIFTLLLAFAFQVSAQENLYPNELKGYKFFANGKLKNLRLGISTKENVKKIFGENCEITCDYGEKWRINFSYFEDITKETTIGNKKIKYIASPKYIGKLYSIILYPKLSLFFRPKDFSGDFSKGFGGSYAHYGKGGGTNTSYTRYSDKYGLDYNIFDEITLTTEKTPSKWKKGNLISVEYKISDKSEEKMFVEQK